MSETNIEQRLDALGSVQFFRPNKQPTPSERDILPSPEFVRGFVPPDYLWDGILVRGFTYSLTAKTGVGKTAVGLRLAAHVALGRALAGREVRAGRVLMLAGENPDDVRMRWIALAEQMGFDADEIDVAFRPGVCRISDIMPALYDYAAKFGDLGLVLVDTSAAYFDGQEENSNTELGAHARTLRGLASLPGNPTVLVCCHPTKNAADDNLQPRGGGAFIAEIDGNLIAKAADGSIELHWQGKLRGPDFPPVMFELSTVESDKLITASGRHIPTVVARALTNSEAISKAISINADLQHLMSVMARHPNATVAALATNAGWILRSGDPHKSKVDRSLKELAAHKLAEKLLGSKWGLTPKGMKAATQGAKPC
ncbi:MAG: AAA family ATPase [Rhizomicrobium sp.]